MSKSILDKSTACVSASLLCLCCLIGCTVNATLPSGDFVLYKSNKTPNINIPNLAKQTQVNFITPPVKTKEATVLPSNTSIEAIKEQPVTNAEPVIETKVEAKEKAKPVFIQPRKPVVFLTPLK